MNIQLTIGSVNFTDWLHITIVRVSDDELVWEDWYDMPVSSLVVQATGLDAGQYYVRMYDAPDDSSLGLLKAEAAVSGLSAQYEYELKFYTRGDLPGTASLNSAGDELTDTYLISKTIHSIQKEGFRVLIPTTEWTFNDTTGKITFPTTSVAPSETVVVTIQNSAGASNNGDASLYNSNLDITASTQTLTADDKNKRIRLIGTVSTQVVTLPALSSVSDGDGFLFDNTIGGVAVQVKLLTTGTDRVNYNRFSNVTTQLSEFWLNKGEYALIRKVSSKWEVILTNVSGEIGSSFYSAHNSYQGALLGNGRSGSAAYSGDDYPRIWWWITTVNSASNIESTSVNDLSYTHPSGQEYKWVKHPTLKLFRPPNTNSTAPAGRNEFYKI